MFINFRCCSVKGKCGNNDDFSRFTFQPKEISTSIIYEISLERTGAIQFFFLYNDQTTNAEKSTLPFYITVLIQGKEIKLDDIQLKQFFLNHSEKLMNSKNISKKLLN